MAEKKHLLTAEGAKALRAELTELKDVRRTEIAKKIKEARAQGDLSENAEYDAALDEQAQIEARIAELQAIVDHSEIIEETTDTSRVYIGATVTVKDLDFDDEYDVTIVGSNESDSINNLISNDSPMGTALLGAKVGDQVTVDAPAGAFSLKVLKIRKAGKK